MRCGRRLMVDMEDLEKALKEATHCEVRLGYTNHLRKFFASVSVRGRHFGTVHGYTIGDAAKKAAVLVEAS